MSGQTQEDPASYVGVFAEILAIYLKRKDVNQTQLAMAIHVRPNAVSQWLKGIRLPNDFTLIHSIAEQLDLNDDEKDALFAALNRDTLLRNAQAYMEKASNRERSKLSDTIEALEKPVRKVHSGLQRWRW